jgi:hypothetical protein
LLLPFEDPTAATMANKTLLVFIVFDLVFLLCAGLHLFIPLYTRMNIKNNTNVDNIASNLLLDNCPLTGMWAPKILGACMEHGADRDDHT